MSIHLFKNFSLSKSRKSTCCPVVNVPETFKLLDGKKQTIERDFGNAYLPISHFVSTNNCSFLYLPLFVEIAAYFIDETKL